MVLLLAVVNILVAVIHAQDFPPRFIKSSLVLIVSEDAKPGFVIDHLNKYVNYSKPEDVLRYSIDATGRVKFKVAEQNGTISVKDTLDRENTADYNFQCTVADTYDGEIREARIFVYLYVTDVNDNPPSFQGNQHIDIDENTTVGSTIFKLTATDPDFGSNKDIGYSFNVPNEIFSIEENSGEVILKKSLDYETSQSYVLRVVATDKGTPPLSSTALLTISVNDVPDSPPIFQSSPYNIQIKENVPLGESILHVHAFDGDTGINAPIVYELLPGGDAMKFSVNKSTGILQVVDGLDREATYTYSMRVKASEAEDSSSSAIASVIVFLLDVNDNPPTFLSPSYRIVIGENTPINTMIKRGFDVFDRDVMPENNEFRFSLVEPKSYFIINSTTGYLYVNGVMDFEQQEEFVFQVVAMETSTIERLSGNATVTVALENVNDNAPSFYQSAYEFTVLESVSTGTFIGSVKASDNDKGSFGEITYSLQGLHSKRFLLNKTSGELFVDGMLDYETVPHLQLSVYATDNAIFNQKSDSALIDIYLSDANDNAPTFDNLPPTIRVEENKENVDIYTVKASDADSGNNAKIFFSIQNLNISFPVLSIGLTTGVVTLLKALDYEKLSSLVFEVTARDHGVPPLETKKNVTLIIEDVNDNPPIFNQSIYYSEVIENVDIYTFVVQLHATDDDAMLNGVVDFVIFDGNIGNAFQIENTGVLLTRNVIDREKIRTFNLTIVAKDRGTPPMSSSCNVIVDVIDVNDEAPIFTEAQYQTSVLESVVVGSTLIKVSATDKDTGKNSFINYTLLTDGSGNREFLINQTTGEIFVAKQLDWETTKSYTLAVKAEDNGEVTKSRTVIVFIEVLDANDNAPIFLTDVYLFNVVENFPDQFTVGLVTAVDADGKLPPNQNGIVTYYIIDGNTNDSFAINSQFGIIYTNKMLDREFISKFNLTILAKDGGNISHESRTNVLISVDDMNDNAPVFNDSSYTTLLAENTTVGANVLKLFATDKDTGNNGLVVYSLLPFDKITKMFIMTTDGMLLLQSNLDYEEDSYYVITAIAQDSGLQRLSSTVQIYINVTDINDNPPQFLKGSYEGFVYEARNNTQSIIQVVATDKDSGLNAKISYSLVNTTSNNNSSVHIDSVTGVISTTAIYNRDETPFLNLTVQAKDHGTPSLMSTTVVNVIIKDSNTHAPIMHNLPASINVSEATGYNVRLFQINTTDDDLGENAAINYYIVDGSENRFVVDRYTGELFTSSLPTDYEDKRIYNLTINVTDNGTPILWSFSYILIYVTDINDNTPVFDPNPLLYPEMYVQRVLENSPPSTLVMDIDAQDKDSGLNALITYSISTDESNFVTINSTSGVVTLRTALDRESDDLLKNSNGFGVLMFTVTARDMGDQTQIAQVKVTVLIADVNDNSPKFEKSSYRIGLTEGVSSMSEVLTLRASDADLGYNARVWYIIVSGNTKDAFSIAEKYSGTILVAKQLDREETPVYNLTVMALDDAAIIGERTLNSTVSVQIYLDDINDNDPKFSEGAYTTNIDENVLIGTKCLKVIATDLDLGSNGDIWYEIISGNMLGAFKIDNATGWIITAGDVDREKNEIYQLVVKAEDFGYPAPRKATVSVTIVINDLNDNTPVFTSNLFHGSIYENQVIDTIVNFDKSIQATDVDSIDQNSLTFTLSGPDSIYFIINSKTGTIFSATIFDRELKDVYNITINVTDNNGYGYSSKSHVIINIVDINDNTPLFNESVTNISIREDLLTGSVVYTAKAIDNDYGKNADLTYFLQGGNGKFEIDSKSGVITLISLLDWESQPDYVLKVIAKDGGNPQLQANTTISIHLLDTIDSKPYFKVTDVQLFLYENVTVGTNIYVVEAFDDDLDDSLYYEIVQISVPIVFVLKGTTGALITNSTLDRELISHYSMVIQGRDSAGLYTVNNLTIAITILDINDNRPIFTNQQCQNDLYEDTKIDTIILTVLAYDDDVGNNSRVRYSLSDDVQLLLQIDAERGFIKTKISLVPYVLQILNFTVFASDQGIPQQNSSLQCSVNVLDINNNRPAFNQSNYVIYVAENVAIGFEIVTITASENDVGINALMTYSITGGQNLFDVNNKTGTIYTIQSLDREKVSYVVATLSAVDNGSPPQQGVTILTFYITDVNDVTPHFEQNIYKFSIRENQPLDTFIGFVKAIDGDVAMNALLNYTIVGHAVSYAIVNSTTGEIRSVQSFDREKQNLFNFTIKASDNGIPALSSETIVLLDIDDVNDNAPLFEEPIYKITIPENLLPGTSILAMKSTDIDEGRNAEVSYVFIFGNEARRFGITETTGVVTVIQNLDVEAQPLYNLTVKAFDKGIESLSSTTTIIITLSDVNDNPPLFKRNTYYLSVPEDVSANSAFGFVEAIDNDLSPIYNKVYYELTAPSNVFSINNTSGELYVQSRLDREHISTYDLQVKAYNVENGSATLHSETDVKIQVLDINDNSPIFTPLCCYVNASESLSVDDFVYRITAVDADLGNNSVVTYNIQDGNDLGIFSMDLATGIIKLNKKLDREIQNLYILTIMATDQGNPPLSTNTTVTINVLDVNDEKPLFKNISLSPVSEDSAVGTYIATIVAVDNDIGLNRLVSYSIISGNEDGDLYLNTTSGVLETAKTLDYERTPRYKLQVEAKDNGLPALTNHQLFVVPVGNINDNMPSFPSFSATGSVKENSPIDSLVARIQANDPDGDLIIYSINAGNENKSFAISSTTGDITTLKVLDREVKSSYMLQVKAENKVDRRRRAVDGTGGSFVNISIEIEDENDNSPLFKQDIYIGGISEDTGYGTNVLQLKAIDADISDKDSLVYEISGHASNDLFILDSKTGWISTKELFADKSGIKYEFNVVVKDNLGQEPYFSDSAVVKISILTNLQRIVITMATNPTLVKTHQSDISDTLQNITGYLIYIDEVQYATTDGEKYDFSKTALYFHAVDSSSNEILSKDAVISKLDNSNQNIKEFFEKWNVTKYEGKVGAMTVKNKEDEKGLHIAIGVSASVVAIFILFIVVVCRWRHRQKRKLKAVTTSVFKSDAELKNISHTFHVTPTRNHLTNIGFVSSEVIPIKVQSSSNSGLPVEYYSKFKNFHGGSYTFESKEENHSLYLEPDHHENDGGKSEKNLTLLEIIAKQEKARQENEKSTTSFHDNKKYEGDDYYSEDDLCNHYVNLPTENENKADLEVVHRRMNAQKNLNHLTTDEDDSRRFSGMSYGTTKSGVFLLDDNDKINDVDDDIYVKVLDIDNDGRSKTVRKNGLTMTML